MDAILPPSMGTASSLPVETKEQRKPQEPVSKRISDLIDSFLFHFSMLDTDSPHLLYPRLGSLIHDFFKITLDCEPEGDDKPFIFAKLTTVLGRVTENLSTTEDADHALEIKAFLTHFSFFVTMANQFLRGIAPHDRVSQIIPLLNEISPSLRAFYFFLLFRELESREDQTQAAVVVSLILLDAQNLSSEVNSDRGFIQLWDLIPSSIYVHIIHWVDANAALGLKSPILTTLMGSKVYDFHTYRCFLTTMRLRASTLRRILSEDFTVITHENGLEVPALKKPIAIALFAFFSLINSFDVDFIHGPDDDAIEMCAHEEEERIKMKGTPSKSSLALMGSYLVLRSLHTQDDRGKEHLKLCSLKRLYSISDFLVGCCTMARVSKLTTKRMLFDSSLLQDLSCARMVDLYKQLSTAYSAAHLSPTTFHRQILAQYPKATYDLTYVKLLLVFVRPSSLREVHALWELAVPYLFPTTAPPEFQVVRVSAIGAGQVRPNINIVDVNQKFRNLLAIVDEVVDAEGHPLLALKKLVLRALRLTIAHHYTQYYKVSQLEDIAPILAILEKVLELHLHHPDEFNLEIANLFQEIKNGENSALNTRRLLSLYGGPLQYTKMVRSQMFGVFGAMIPIYALEVGMPNPSPGDIRQLQTMSLALHHLTSSPFPDQISIKELVQQHHCDLSISSLHRSHEALVEQTKQEGLKLQEELQAKITKAEAQLEKARALHAKEREQQKADREQQKADYAREKTVLKKTLAGLEGKIRELEQAIEGTTKQLTTSQEETAQLRLKAASDGAELARLSRETAFSRLHFALDGHDQEGLVDSLTCGISLTVPKDPVTFTERARKKYHLEAVQIADRHVAIDYLKRQQASEDEIKASIIPVPFFSSLIGRLESASPKRVLHSGENVQPILAALDDISTMAEPLIVKCRSLPLSHTLNDRLSDIERELAPDGQLTTKRLLRAKIRMDLQGATSFEHIIHHLRVVAESSLKLILLTGGQAVIMQAPSGQGPLRDSHKLCTLMRAAARHLSLGDRFEARIAGFERVGMEYHRSEYHPRPGVQATVYQLCASITDVLARDPSEDDKAALIASSEQLIPEMTGLLETVRELLTITKAKLKL